MFRLAETLRVADPSQIEKKLPPALIADWYKYFDYKDKRFDKVEYYLYQLSVLIGDIAGVRPEDLLFDRGDKKKKAARAEKVTPEQLEKVLRAAFGV